MRSGPQRRQLLLALAAVAVAPAVRTRAAALPGLNMAYWEGFSPLSFVQDGAVAGILPEAVAAIAAQAGCAVHDTALPWARAQAMVKAGKLDGFCTAPTAARQEYALFARTPVIDMRVGLVRRRDDRRFDGADSLTALQDGRVVDYLGNGWTREHLPGWPVTWVTDKSAALRLVAIGRADLYFAGEVATPEDIEAAGLSDRLRFDPLPFLGSVPLNIGLRRSYPDAAEVIERIDAGTRAFADGPDLGRLVGKYGFAL